MHFFIIVTTVDGDLSLEANCLLKPHTQSPCIGAER